MKRFAISILVGALIAIQGLCDEWMDVETGITWSYLISGENAVLSNMSRPEKVNVVVPETLGGCPVVSIAQNTFRSCQELISVTISSGVTNIGQYAFADCRKLERVKLPSRLSVIQAFAFQNCEKLESLTIPSNLLVIGQGAFGNCYSIPEVSLPPGIKSLGASVFSNCRMLTSVAIPFELAKFAGVNLFSGCPIRNATVPAGNFGIAFGGVTNLVVSEGTENIANAFTRLAQLKSVTIPSSVTRVSASNDGIGIAFLGCGGIEQFRVDPVRWVGTHSAFLKG